MMKRSIAFCVGLFLLGLQAGCAHTTFTEANDHIAQTQSNMQQQLDASAQVAPPVVVKPGYYVDTQPTALPHGPAWLNRRVDLTAQQLPLNVLLKRLLRQTPANVNFSSDISDQQTISLHFKGTIRAALAAIGRQLDAHYQVDGNQITWSTFETKTMSIAFMPGASNYMVGRTRNASSSNDSSSGAATHVSRIDDQQYSNLEARLSVWQDLRQTLNDMISKDGKVMISESTTTVTVTDHPSRVAAVSAYINKLNRSLSQEVAIRVQVLDLKLNKAFNFGIDWNLIASDLGHHLPGFQLTGNLSSASNLVANNLIDRDRNSAIAGLKIGQMNGAQSIINALSKQGKLRVVTKPEVVTMNNQMASIRITQDTGYVESVSQSQSANSDYATSSITPGTVTDGFTLYVLPKIQGNRVYMQISSTMSSLESLEKQSTIPAGMSSSAMSGGQYNAIEVPTIAEKVFNQRSVVRSGSTLIIAGYKQLRDETAQSKLFGISALGGQGAKTDNIETLVLITPTILPPQP